MTRPNKRAAHFGGESWLWQYKFNSKFNRDEKRWWRNWTIWHREHPGENYWRS